MKAAVTDRHELDQEYELLEAVEMILEGSGEADLRVTRALALVRDRLKALQRQGMGSGPPEDRGPALQATLVGASPAMRQVAEEIARVSRSHATVLLRGESGTGKELVAKAIHLSSERARGPFVRLHCAAVADTLLESELFGHEKGAFTGAVETRKGRFELADGGTLFLDEVGDIPLPTQVKLLRVLQERCFERVGGSRQVAVDVRVISATHRDLEAMVRAGTFREDLYYRLNVVPITLPPLRERAGDVSVLIEHFLARSNRENRRLVRLGADLLSLMNRYHWPGNVRELQNCIERLVVMAEPSTHLLTVETVPVSLRGYFQDMQKVTRDGGETGRRGAEAASLGETVRELEREKLLAALERTGWVQAKAARVLGITARQIAYRMRKYHLSEAGTR